MADPFKDRDTPWRDKAALKRLYVDEGFTQSEIGDKFGVSQRTISRMMEKFDIDTSSGTPDLRLQDPDEMRSLYCEKKHTVTEIAERFNCSRSCVIGWLRRHNIERRGRIEEATRAIRKKPPKIRTDQSGYEVVESTIGGETDHLRVHRLIYAAEYGVNAVDGKIIHHRNGIPWDNRPGNLEAMSAENHGRHHRPIDFQLGRANPSDRHENV